MRKHRHTIKLVKKALKRLSLFTFSMLIVATVMTTGISANTDEVYHNEDKTVLIAVNRNLNEEKNEITLDFTISNDENVKVTDIQIEGTSIKNDDFLYSHAVGENWEFKFSVITTRMVMLETENEEAKEIERHETFIFTVKVAELKSDESLNYEATLPVNNENEVSKIEEKPSDVPEEAQTKEEHDALQVSEIDGKRVLNRLPNPEELDTIIDKTEYVMIDNETGIISIETFTHNEEISFRRALDVVTTGKKVTTGTVRVEWRQNRSFFWEMWGGVSELFVNGNRSYCLEPAIMDAVATSAAYGTTFDDLNVLRVHPDGRLAFKPTKAQETQLELISNYGRKYPGHETDAYEWATKILMWEALGWDVVLRGSINPQAEINEINRLIANHTDRPSWHGEVRKARIGEEITLTDPTLSQFNVNMNVTTGLTVLSKTGNSITVRIDAKQASLAFTKIGGSAEGTSYIYTDGVSQRAAHLKILDPMKSIIDFEAKSHMQRFYKQGENGEPLAGFKFRTSYINKVDENGILSGDANNHTWDYITGADGFTAYDEWNNEERTVYVQEIEAKAPYTVNHEIKTFIVTSGAETTMTFTNKKAVGQISLLKLDNHRNPLANIKFNILNASNTIVGTLVTGADGKALSATLPLGTYKLQETSVTSGIVLDESLKEVKIEYANQTTEVVLVSKTISNKYQRSNVTITKVENDWDTTFPEYNGIKLSDATIELFAKNDIYEGSTLIYRANELLGTEVTNAAGQVTFHNLPIGDYYAKEKVSPTGYVLFQGQWDISIKYDDNNPKVEVTQTGLTVTNQVIYGKATLIKTNGGRDLLEGAVFGVFTKDGVKITELTTNRFGMIITPDLRYGDYYFQEFKAPIGHWFDNTKIPFTISEHESMQYVTMPNKLIEAKILIHKVDSETLAPLAGVGFKILDSNNNIVTIKYQDGKDVVEKSEWFTDEDGEFMLEAFLPYGEYTLIESHTLEGYNPIDPIKFTIDENQDYINLEVIGSVLDLGHIGNTKIYGDLLIKKISAETGLSLPGFVFDVYNAQMERVDTITTDENGEASLNHLVYGQYHAVEKFAPFPYVINPDKARQSFFVSEEGKVYELVFKNMTTSITIFKGDQDGNPIPNTVFDLYNSDKNFLETVTTDESGTAVVEGYDFGTYFVEEIEVPFPYVINPENKLLELKLTETNNHYTIEFKNEKAVGEYLITKLDSKTQVPIANVSYGIYDVSHILLAEGETFKYEDVKGLKAHEIGLTDTNGHLVFNDLDIERKWAIIELETPYGYIIDETVRLVEFEYVDNNTPVITEEVTLLNERLQVTIKGVKIDSVTRSQIISQYFDLVLRDKDGNIIPLDHKDENGVHVWVVDALEFYFMNEEKAPTGYILSNEIIEISTHEEKENHLYVIEFPNDEEPAPLPKTGMAESPFMTLSFLILALGLILVLYTKRKESTKKSVQYVLLDSKGNVVRDVSNVNGRGFIDLGKLETDSYALLEKSDFEKNQGSDHETKKDKLE
ncbi:LPXTG cell wall anchor domain-containing protein [Erysipelothrix aquatica]|uniref:LPXTG cell wall anchor domain-containing protein n=1 Tax=Erysipelothrix aquatica TaxID=2683714 RepID=UPI00135713A2|nr:LPXTG cell wall anchor domain-containing protein [Erysipelothrix aquatica]